jgi:hypothetical protein
MDSALITAVVTAYGTLVGASPTIAITIVTQRAHRVHAEREEKLRNRKTPYAEFITEASRLTVEALRPLAGTIW